MQLEDNLAVLLFNLVVLRENYSYFISDYFENLIGVLYNGNFPSFFWCVSQCQKAINIT